MSRNLKTSIVSRRICWPDPDATCIQGGCGYCNYHRFRSIKTIEDYCREKGTLKHRGNGEEVDAVQTFYNASHQDFYNAEVRYG